MNGRMLGRLCLMSAILLSAWRIGVCADEPKSAPPATQPGPNVAALVQQLGGDVFKERETAQAALIDMGEAAVPALNAQLKSDLNPEAKARVEATLAKIAENRLIGATFVTLHYTDAPLQTVMDDFIKQAGTKMGTDRKDVVEFMQDKKITINVDHVSFWEALHQITQSSGLVLPIGTNGGSNKMILSVTGGGGGFGGGMGGSVLELPTDVATVAGPFIIIPQTCTLTRTVQYGKDGGNAAAPAPAGKMGMGVVNMPVRVFNGGMNVMGGGSEVSLVCACEPKLHVMEAINSDCLKEMVDEKGHDLLGQARGNGNVNNMMIRHGMYGMMGQNWYTPISVELKDSPELGKKIATIKGIIKATVATKSSTFVVEDVMKPGVVMQKVGSMTVTFAGATKQPNLTQLRISVTWPDHPNASNQLQMLARDMQITDANGNAMPVNPMVSGINGDRVDLLLQNSVFVANGQPQATPKKLVWEIPTDSRPLEIPFELHDLPLPE